MARDESLGVVMGRVIREARHECGWSQRQLAARLGVSQSAIARLERGHLDYLDVRLVTRAFDELGIRPVFDGRTLGLIGRREQRDRVHAACATYGKRRMEAAGWATSLEAELGSGRGRGWIDLLAYRETDRALLVTEFKTEIHDVGKIQRTLGWYERAAWQPARQRGWRANSFSTALLVLDTVENDARIRANRDLFATEFPVRGRMLDEWLRTPGGPAIRGLALIDPRSRRADWLRPTRTDGRRTPAPYADYRDAAQRLSRR